MKLILASLITGVLLTLNCGYSFSQSQIHTHQTSSIAPTHLVITFFKTTNLIFPSAIKSVDRGSPDILAQKAKGVENVLLLKASRENFIQTNLSVITTDNKLYTFVIDYASNPISLTILIRNISTFKENLPLIQSSTNDGQLQKLSQKILEARTKFATLKDKKYKMQLYLKGLYIQDKVSFCFLEIKNRSHITYDVAMLRFFIRDAKRSKRTATQEIEINPLYIDGDASEVKGHSRQLLVFALPKFTIPDQKYLTIQLREQNGGRHLALKVRNRTLVKSRLLADL